MTSISEITHHRFYQSWRFRNPNQHPYNLQPLDVYNSDALHIADTLKMYIWVDARQAADYIKMRWLIVRRWAYRIILPSTLILGMIWEFFHEWLLWLASTSNSSQTVVFEYQLYKDTSNGVVLQGLDMLHGRMWVLDEKLNHTVLQM